MAAQATFTSAAGLTQRPDMAEAPKPPPLPCVREGEAVALVLIHKGAFENRAARNVATFPRPAEKHRYSGEGPEN